MTTTTTNGLVVPDLGEAANGPAAFLAMAQTIDGLSYGAKVADLATLDATPGLFPGQRKYVESLDEVGVWDDTLVAWTGVTRSYTPTLVNVTGAATASYVVQGKWVTMDFTVTFTGAAGGSVSMTVPFAAALATAPLPRMGGATLRDNSPATLRIAQVFLSTSTTVTFGYEQTNVLASVGATTPWTWATGDTISGQITYRRA